MEVKTNNTIEVINVSKKYDNKLVVKNVNLTIPNQARIGIVGPNGSGKTTLCEMIAQLRKPSEGKINLRENIKIGMQLQESKYPRNITAWDLIDYYLRTYRLKKTVKDIQKLLFYLDAENIINKPIANLSGGQQQKINILLALIIDPDLLILDELATGLDLEVRERIYQLLEEEIFSRKDLSVLIVSHNMNEIEKFCDQLVFMLNGEIISINDVQHIIKEYKTVENFVKEKFKDYKIGMYNQSEVEEKLSADNNESWAKALKKINKDKKDDKNDN